MAELLEREKQARAEAEAASQRLQFLYQATGVLFAGQVSGTDKLTKLAKLVVPHVADWCVVDVIDAAGTMTRVAATHWNPARVEAAQEIIGVVRCDVSMAGVPQVLSSNKPVVFDDVQAMDPTIAASDSVRVLAELGARSIAVVPLVGVRRTLGAVTFAFAESHRRYEEEELELLADLCTRAAWAVENAELYEKAQHAVQAREDLLAVVSHDLRNPLGTISMAASLLQKSAGHAEKTLRNGERISRAAAQMERLIRDLLDIAAIESGHFAVERVPWRVSALLAEAIDSLIPLAKEKGLKLSASLSGDDLEVRCDRDRTLQVFSNLIGNAVKFTAEGGTITLGGREDNGFIRFSVADTGSGIAAEQLPHIFDRYWQARPTDRRGVGLGLSIAAGIVAAHGGRIWADSTLGQGTTFYFTLPRAVTGI